MPLPLALIIEDEPDLAELFSKAFLKGGYDTQIISDGRVAQEQLGLVLPAAVVLDLHLPGVSGLKLLEQIRADARLKDTRVIMVTGDPFSAGELAGRADLALTKPVGYLQLRDLAIRLRTTGSLG